MAAADSNIFKNEEERRVATTLSIKYSKASADSCCFHDGKFCVTTSRLGHSAYLEKWSRTKTHTRLTSPSTNQASLTPRSNNGARSRLSNTLLNSRSSLFIVSQRMSFPSVRNVRGESLHQLHQLLQVDREVR